MQKQEALLKQTSAFAVVFSPPSFLALCLRLGLFEVASTEAVGLPLLPSSQFFYRGGKVESRGIVEM